MPPAPGPDHRIAVIHRFATAEADDVAALVEQSVDSDDITMLVMAALFAASPIDPLDVLDRAAAVATTIAERQTITIAIAHLAGDTDRVGALARDHLIDHPDGVLVAWIAAHTPRSTNTQQTNTQQSNTHQKGQP